MKELQALAALDDLVGQVNKAVNQLNDEAHGIAVEWSELFQTGRAGDDEAARLILRIAGPLSNVETICKRLGDKMRDALSDT